MHIHRWYLVLIGSLSRKLATKEKQREFKSAPELNGLNNNWRHDQISWTMSHNMVDPRGVCPERPHFPRGAIIICHLGATSSPRTFAWPPRTCVGPSGRTSVSLDLAFSKQIRFQRWTRGDYSGLHLLYKARRCHGFQFISWAPSVDSSENGRKEGRQTG